MGLAPRLGWVQAVGVGVDADGSSAGRPVGPPCINAIINIMELALILASQSSEHCMSVCRVSRRLLSVMRTSLRPFACHADNWYGLRDMRMSQNVDYRLRQKIPIYGCMVTIFNFIESNVQLGWLVQTYPRFLIAQQSVNSFGVVQMS